MALESSPENPQPLRLVAHLVRGWIDRLGPVWVEAQLIEINRRSGRTIFLTLRDKLAEVSASATISPTTLDSAGPLTEGATVVVRLKPAYFEQSGRFSFSCDAITPVGEGRLLARLEQTKRLLQAEGLFDPALKKPLPFLPRVVGLITGAGSAAERDVIENARRRWPAVRLAVRHALVQGAQAAEQVMVAVAALDGQPDVDVIVIARGGGSLEDLLPFSDEGLVRAVFACRTPVVSAIGHETDNPILDLVADFAPRRRPMRPSGWCPTPPMSWPGCSRPGSGSRGAWPVWCSGSRNTSTLCAPGRCWPIRPPASLSPPSQIEALGVRARRAINTHLDRESVAVRHHLAHVRAVSPKATLERGYAILVGPDGHSVGSVTEVDPGDDLLAHLSDGQLVVEVRDDPTPRRSMTEPGTNGTEVSQGSTTSR